MLRFWLLVPLTGFLIGYFPEEPLRAADQHASPLVASVEAVTDGGDLKLADGRLVCLAGLSIPAANGGDRALGAWRRLMATLIDRQDVRLTEVTASPFDRYGCLVAWVETADGVLLQHALLEQGLAVVQVSPAFDDEARIDAMLALEDQARRARLGIWNDGPAAVVQAADSDAWVGHRQIIEGRVRRVSGNDRYVYLNLLMGTFPAACRAQNGGRPRYPAPWGGVGFIFGADWRTDFTARLHRRQIDRQGLDPQEFKGKRLRVRGFVQESRGPLIDVSHPKQIEVLP